MHPYCSLDRPLCSPLSGTRRTYASLYIHVIYTYYIYHIIYHIIYTYYIYIFTRAPHRARKGSPGVDGLTSLKADAPNRHEAFFPCVTPVGCRHD